MLNKEQYNTFTQLRLYKYGSVEEFVFLEHLYS